MKNRIFTVILYKEDNMYIAECPEVGTVDQGETIEQAIAGLKEATRLYLEEFTGVADLRYESSFVGFLKPRPKLTFG
ncbi:MAG: type II toxin-antitoxin system HicB family antitoxin [Microcystis sp. LE19-114.1B]|jgi:predicted RNase H-like HicB family nuclease|nr:type II toxin-antitoxin system HicB family antitoxin [Microcystis sp. LE19-114.1B]